MIRALLIVDFQRDFVNGCMATRDSDWKCMQATADLYNTPKNYYKSIMFSLADFPVNYKCFDTKPKHCICHSLGASIDECLYNAAISYTDKLYYYPRGSSLCVNSTSFISDPSSRCRFIQKVKDDAYDQIDIIGISNNIIELILDMCDFGYDRYINVRTKLCASDDYNTKLISVLNEKGVKFDDKL